MPRPPRIAIACSGLGHIQRGIEAWAHDLAAGLRESSVDATLFGAGAGADAVMLRCLRRASPGARGIANLSRHLGGWRYGCGSPYEVEQTTFALALWRRVRSNFDILHVQDPRIATILQRAHRRGLSRPKVLFANGTGAQQAIMRRFDYIQLLTPQTFNAWQSAKPPGQNAFLVPNFIDTSRFTPGDQRQARAALNLPPTGPLVLCCAAIRRYHKRVDYLLYEFAAALPALPPDTSLLIAGGVETDTPELVSLGIRLLGDKVRFLTNVPRGQMPLLYQAADQFVLPSLTEMFGIVLLEAMASGLPVLCHDTPDFRFVAGPAGCYRDLAQPGALAAAMVEAMHQNVRQELAKAARPHVEQRFSAAAVVSQILSIYTSMLGTSDNAHVG